MRTVIFLGLGAIADAINNNWLHPGMVGFMAIVLIGAIVMDITEFVKNISK